MNFRTIGAVASLFVLLLGAGFRVYSSHQASLERVERLEKRLAELADRPERGAPKSERLVNFIREEAKLRRRELEDETEDAPAAAPRDRADERAQAREREVAKLNQTPVQDFAPIHDAYDAEFAAEDTDVGWAVEAKRLVHNGLLEHIPEGSQIQNVDCRAKMCRVESLHANRDKAYKLVELGLADPSKRPWNGLFSSGLVSEEEPGGPVVLVTYLMREGRELPDWSSDQDEAVN